MASQLLTIEEAMEYFSTSRRTMYELVKIKDFPAVKIMGEWRIVVDRLDAYYTGLLENKDDNV
jgi:excisionase family DNA binding protein